MGTREEGYIELKLKTFFENLSNTERNIKVRLVIHIVVCVVDIIVLSTYDWVRDDDARYGLWGSIDQQGSLTCYESLDNVTGIVN